MDELSLAVVGLRFANTDRSKSNRRFEAALCHPGDPVELRPEPGNKADPLAIAVYNEGGIQLGYLTAERAPLLQRLLAASEGTVAIFQELQQHVAVVRVRFDGRPPTLPVPRPAKAAPPTAHDAADDSGFYPDPDGPEWGA